MQPPRIVDETPASVRTQIDNLIAGIDAITTIRSTLPDGRRKRECDITIDLLYADAAALMEEWEEPCEAQVRKLAQPAGACCGTCGEFQGPEGCNGSWYCTDARREELRRAA